MFVIGTATALATPFTTSVPGTSLVLPSTYPQAGGVAIVLEGANGNVYYQFVNPSTMFQGYQNTGTPAAWQGNPFQITPAMVLFCGPVVSCSTYLGGGITRMTIRFTAYDGDNQTGMFDFNDLSLRINGSNFGASSGNWSPVATQNTDLTGTTLISSGTGFGNNTLDTGWFQSTDPTILSNVLSTGTVTASIFDLDPNDNFWDFKRGNDASTSTVPLNVAPGVTLDKASTTTSFATVGQVIPYTFTYNNIGSVWINNIAVSDPKVTGVSCPAPPAAGTANLDPGEQVVCTANYTVTQADIDTGSIVNTATATGTPQAGSLGPVSDSNTIPGPASAPAVQLTKTASPSPFGAVGSTLTYTFAVQNLGNVTLSNISIADASLPSLSCTSPSVAPGNTVVATCSGNTRTITQANVDSGSISNSATVTARAPNGTTVNATSAITTAGPSRTPAVAMVKTASTINDNDSNGPDAGDTISYSFAVSNTGNVTLTGVTVSDPAVGSVSCPSSTLLPASSISCSATYTLLQSDFETGNITNSATVTGTPPTGPVVTDISGSSTSNDNPTVTALPALPALAIDKTSSTVNFNAVGNAISYSYVVRNVGNVTLANSISVVDNKTTVSCPALPPTGLVPGGSITCTSNYSTTQSDIDAGGVTNIARAETTFGPGNAAVTSPDDTLTVPAVQVKSMTLSKVAMSVAFINVGDIATYDYIVTNTGNTSIASPITVTDNRVSPVTCPSLPPGGLPPGGILTCSATYSILLEDLDLGSVTNLATASGGGANSPQVSVTIPTGASPALTVVKSSTTTSVNTVGSVIPYSYRVTNTGNATFTRPITIVDDKIGTISCWTPTGPDPTFIPAVGATPAESVTCSANYVVTQSDFDSGHVTNQAHAATTYGAANIPVTSPIDEFTVNVVQRPELTVSKNVATLPIAFAGQVLTYTVLTQNTGDVTLLNITVTDPLIPSMSCVVPTLAVNATTVCNGNYTVTQADFDAGQIANTASATGATPQGAVVTDQGSRTTLTSPANPSLTLDKTATPNSYVAVGETVNYGFVVSNNGNVTLTNISVTDPLVPAFSCVIPILTPGASDGSCAMSYTVAQSDIDAGQISNTASATATAARGTNPSTTDTVIVTGPTRSPAVTLTKTAIPDTFASIGNAISYNYTVTNTGNVSLTGAVSVADDRLPSVSCPPLPVSGLLPGGTVSCSATHIVTQADLDSGAIVNTATAQTNSILGALTSSPVVETATAIQTGGVTLVKTASAVNDSDANGDDAGDTIDYTFVVSNTGNVTLSNIVVTDPIVGSVSCTLTTLLPATSTTCSATYTIRQSDMNDGGVTNSATVTGATPSSSTVSDISGSAADNNSATVSSLNRSPEIAVIKTAGSVIDNDSNGSDPGDTINYSFAVSNEGNVTLTDLVVNDPKIQNVSCPVLVLAPGASTVCAASYTLTQDDVNAGEVINRATASGRDPVGVSVTDLSGSSINDDAPTITPINQSPGITLVKSAGTVGDLDGNGHDVGDSIIYSFLVSNSGNVTLTSVGISDPKTGPVGCPSSVLAPFSSMTCSVTYILTQVDIDLGIVSNTAVASATTPANTSISDVSGSTDGDNLPTEVSINQTPALRLEKSSPAASFDAVGDILSYQYVLTNSGNVTLSGPFGVSDDKTTVTCPAVPVGGLPPSDTLMCTASYSVTQADIDSGAVVNSATGSSTFGPTNLPVSSSDDQVTVPAIQSPAMSVAKSATSINFSNVGDAIDYQYIVTNTGNTTLLGPITVSDDRISAVNCPTSDLAPGATLTCTASYSVQLADLEIGSVTNLASASNAQTTSLLTSLTVPPNASPALTIAKSAPSLSFTSLGDTIAYNFLLTNSGGATFTRSITVTDDKIGTIACWTPGATDLTFAPGETQSCTANYIVTQPDLDRGFVTNQAFAGTTYGASNISVTSAPDDLTVTANQLPALNVTKSVSNLPVFNVGQQLTYTITTANSGNVTLSNVQVTDPLIPVLSCTIPTLAVNASFDCTGTYNVNQADFDAGQIANTATARGAAPQGGPVSDSGGNTTAIVQINLISLVKSAGSITDLDGNGPDAGDQVDYTFSVRNEGNVTLTDVAVTDAKTGPVTCAVATIAPGVSIICQSVYTLTQVDVNAGEVVNTATVNAKAPDGSTVSDTSGSTTTDDINTITSIPSLPRITVVKTAGAINDLDGNGPDFGDTLAYSFVIENAGNQTLNSVSLNDPLFTPPTINCPSTTLLPSGSMTCSAIYTLSQANVDAGRITNQATAEGTPPSGIPVFDYSGSTAADNVQTVTSIPQVSGIAFVKAAGLIDDLDNNGLDAGDVVNYTFQVRNTGNQTLGNVTVSDARAIVAGGPLASLPPGTTDTSTFTATYVLTQTDIDSGNNQNTAFVRGNPPTGPPVDDVSGTDFGNDTPTVIALPSNPGITLVKTSNGITDQDGNGNDAGDTVSYTFTVRNTGNVTLSNIAISDPLVGLASLEGSQATATLLAMAAAGTDPMSTASTSQLIAPLPENGQPSFVSQMLSSVYRQGVGAPEIQSALHVRRKLIRLDTETRTLAVGDRVGIYFEVVNAGIGPLTTIMANQEQAEMLGSGIVLLASNSVQMIPSIHVYTLTDADILKGNITAPAQVKYKSRDVEKIQIVEGALPLADVQAANEVVTASITPVSIPSLSPGASTTFTGTYTLTQVDVDAGNVRNTAVVAGRTPIGSSVNDSSGSTETNDIPTDTPVARNPAIALVKSADPIADNDGNGIDSGDTIFYRLVVSNEGNVTITSLTVLDAKIGAVSCPQTTIAPTSSVTCTATYVLTQQDVDAGEIQNTAVVSGRGPGDTPVQDTSGQTVNDNLPTITVVPRTGGVALIKLAGSPTTNLGADATFTDAGDTITYTFTLRNTGNVTLTAVAVTDAKVPSVTCPVTTLAPSESTDCIGDYTLTLADLDQGSVENSATGSGRGPDGSTVQDLSGSDPSNNTPTTTTLAQNPQLTLVKTAAAPTTAGGLNAALVDAGDTVQYQFDVVNTGSVTLDAVAVADDKIASVSCLLTALAPTEATTCTGSYVLTQVDLDAGSVSNSATATAVAPNGTSTSDVSGTDPGNDTATETPLPQVGLIAIVKIASPFVDVDGNGVDQGDTIEYVFTVTNQGNVTLGAVTVLDAKVGQVSCPATSMAPSATMTCRATYTLTQSDLDAGQVRNQATVTGTPPSGPAVTDLSDPQTPGQGPGENDATVTALTQSPGLTLVKTADLTGLQAPPQSGDLIRYRFVIRNSGNVTITGITLSDPLPGVSVTGGPITTLAPGESDDHSFSATYAVTPADISAGLVENTAVATGAFRDAAGNPATISDSSGTDESNNNLTRVALRGVARVTIVKTAVFNDVTAPTPGANIGDTVTYSFVVTNTGNVQLRNIALVDPMLSGISCPSTTLAASSSMNCSADIYPLTQADINAGEVRNQAIVTSDATIDGAAVGVADDSGTAGGNDEPTVTGLPFVQPAFTKTASKGVARIGDSITYTIRADSVTFAPVTVTDVLPGGLSYVPGSATLNGNPISPEVTGRRIVISGITPTGGNFVITIRARVNASANDGKLINRAQLFHPDGRLVSEARAVVEIRPDPLFDCGDIIGKVFEDANRNGVQDASSSPYVPERGVPGVRVATVNGNLITTDKNGKFHIACADIPNAKIGSNFILKLDPRSLPSGFQLTTENPRVVRLTRGKLTKINFGASASRLIKLDLTDNVFVAGGTVVSPELKAAVLSLIDVLDQEQSIVRLQYHLGEEGKALASKRLSLISKFIASRWEERGGRYKLPIETRLLFNQQGALQ